MKNNRQSRIFLFITALSLICVVTALGEAQFKILRRAYDHYVLDNQNHYLPCKDLPTKSEVERIVEQHREVIQQIEQVAPGSAGVEIDASTCAGKADILIWYGSHPQRIAIEQLLGEDTFFGIPYRMQNR